MTLVYSMAKSATASMASWAPCEPVARGGVAQPARDHPVSAAKGVQRRLEREALLGAPARVRLDESEVAGFVAFEQAHDLDDVALRMLPQIRKDLGVAAVGKSGDFAENRVPERSFDVFGGATKRRGDTGNDAQLGEPPERLKQGAVRTRGSGHYVNSSQCRSRFRRRNLPMGRKALRWYPSRPRSLDQGECE